MHNASQNLPMTILLIAACTLANANSEPITIDAPSQLQSQNIRYVENSYIVTFKNTDQTKAPPIIQPPDRAKNLASPVAFGQRISDQIKDELESLLGIKGQGKVVRIFRTKTQHT